jgi:hypothetical protein
VVPGLEEIIQLPVGSPGETKRDSGAPVGFWGWGCDLKTWWYRENLEAKEAMLSK